MDYKEIKKLLSAKKHLTVSVAHQILDFWEQNPRVYARFLRYDINFRYLEAYDRSSSGKHWFYVSSLKVPSDLVALKFFEIGSDSLNTRFMDVIYGFNEHRLPESGVWAFPYLNKECVDCFSKRFIMSQIADLRAVFNFADDKTGEVFEAVRSRLTSGDERLLFINSFNQDAWWKTVGALQSTLSLDEVYSFCEKFVISHHLFTEGYELEANFRKLYIAFELNVGEAVAAQVALMMKGSGDARGQA